MNRSHICIVSVQKHETPQKMSKKWWSSLSCTIINKIYLSVCFQNPKSEISVQALLYCYSFYKRIMMIIVSSYSFVQLKRRERDEDSPGVKHCWLLLIWFHLWTSDTKWKYLLKPADVCFWYITFRSCF